jgi:hypothetical protein
MNVILVVVDTGAPNHPDINLVKAIDFTGTGVSDTDGHSTFVSSIAAGRGIDGGLIGVCPGAKVYTAKALANGSGSMSAVISGVNWAIQQKKANPNLGVVLNLSLGGVVGTGMSSLDTACDNAWNNNVFVCAAAGTCSTWSNTTHTKKPCFCR